MQLISPIAAAADDDESNWLDSCVKLVAESTGIHCSLCSAMSLMACRLLYRIALDYKLVDIAGGFALAIRSSLCGLDLHVN